MASRRAMELLLVIGVLHLACVPGSCFWTSDVDLECDLELPDAGCYCRRTPDLYVVCRDLGLRSIPDFRAIRRHDIHTLDLSGNFFLDIPRNAFGRLSIGHLILSRNTGSFQSIHRQAFNARQKESLLSLDMRDNHFLAVPEIVRNLTNLHKLHLQGNDIVELRNEDLRGLPNLTDLHIGALNTIQNDVFRDVTQLRLFRISPKAVYTPDSLAWSFFNPGNLYKLSTLETLVINSGVITFDGQFLGSMDSLKHLEISRSAVDDEQLDACQIADTNNILQYLNFANNRLKRFPKAFIKSLQGLEHLDLRHNMISRVPRGAFRKNRALKYVDLSHNRIRVLVNHPLAMLGQLEVVDLRHNRLQRLDEVDFPSRLMDGMEVFLGGNRWYCSCELDWLMDASARQHLGHPGPLDVYEVENELRCSSFLDDVLLYEANNLITYCEK